MVDALYLDHNATGVLKPDARDAMVDALAVTGNPSSVHRFGRSARDIVETAREQLAAMIGADPAGIVFTASGTEANALALNGFPERTVVVSAIEHPSVLRARPDAVVAPVTASGLIDLGALERLLGGLDRPALVSVMLANNETGVVQPIADVVEIGRRFGALVHCDAVQGPGRLGIDFAALGVDMVTVSGHKFGGPLGAAALVLGPDIQPQPLLRGGGQERSRRAGTENVAAIAGFGAAAARVAQDLAVMGQVRALRDALQLAILQEVADVVVFGADCERLPNTLCLALPGVSAEMQLMAFDLAGIAVSAGAACSSGKVAASPVLLAMGIAEDLARAAIRISLGVDTPGQAVDRVTACYRLLATRRQQHRAAE